jgi:hypothetical protein
MVRGHGWGWAAPKHVSGVKSESPQTCVRGYPSTAVFLTPDHRVPETSCHYGIQGETVALQVQNGPGNHPSLPLSLTNLLVSTPSCTDNHHVWAFNSKQIINHSSTQISNHSIPTLVFTWGLSRVRGEGWGWEGERYLGVLQYSTKVLA